MNLKLFDKITVKNYKSFDEIGGGFEQILPINVIIGKNNSGKSTLIDLVGFLTDNNHDFLNGGRNGIGTEVLVSTTLKKEVVSIIFRKGENSSSYYGFPSNYEYGKQFIGREYTYQIESNGKKKYVEIKGTYDDVALNDIRAFADVIKTPLTDYKICKITAERDIIPESNKGDLSLNANGTGATNYIQQIINRTDQDSRLIENELLEELNNIVKPDIDFSRILIQLENSNNYWEIFFEDAKKNRVALSKMGSGVKTILLVLLNLITRPKVERTRPNAYIFAFEELENNLHPSLQRRLFSYISAYSTKNSAYFFLTTHSNVVIDSFSTSDDAQIIHVSHDGNEAKTTSIVSISETKDLLNDLGIKASDLLQSNGVVWVEGPSDRNYINKWIHLINPELKEGIHYSIMFYGGKLLSNLTFDYEWFNRDVIPLLKINGNAFVIMDRDGKSLNSKLNSTKDRISDEIGTENFWITKGREIENYITNDVITKWLNDDHRIAMRNKKFDNDVNTKLEVNIQNIRKDVKLKYNLSKTNYSAEIIKYMEEESLKILDLEDKVKLLVSKIENWNNK
ncbi:ATP-dependent nuclease [Brumimicrobium mesophilum]|uniref:ATP-dependent nuclease n=1 Tax=Brumimicrobium mesophilum TaxID=392717 RepID=UPI000D1410FA|nr:ATP-binding protein [Brumimicrobium mesophilum]